MQGGGAFVASIDLCILMQAASSAACGRVGRASGMSARSRAEGLPVPSSLGSRKVVRLAALVQAAPARKLLQPVRVNDLRSVGQLAWAASAGN